jgi:F0F1-type ATP synthase assembly protein I
MMKDVFRSLGIATQVGLMVVASILISLLLGLWLDDKLGTAPCATLILTIVGVLVGCMSTYRLASSLVEKAGLKREVKAGVVLSLKDAFGSLALAAQMGLLLAGSVLVSLFLGLWIDARLDSRPWATLLLAALGILIGSVGVSRLGSSMIKRLEDTRKENNSA